MKQIILFIAIIALVVLSACSNVQQPVVDDDNQTNSSTADTQPAVNTQPVVPTSSEPDYSALEIKGHPSKCLNLSVYDMRTKCSAIETRNPTGCAEMKKQNDLEECYLEVSKYSFDKSKVSSCNNINDPEKKITCQALFDLDEDVCLTMKKSLTAASSMQKCVNMVSTKLLDKKICNTFKTKSDAFVKACFQNCNSRWVDSADENVGICESAVDAGFKPIF